MGLWYIGIEKDVRDAALFGAYYWTNVYRVVDNGHGLQAKADLLAEFEAPVHHPDTLFMRVRWGPSPDGPWTLSFLSTVTNGTRPVGGASRGPYFECARVQWRGGGQHPPRKWLRLLAIAGVDYTAGEWTISTAAVLAGYTANVEGVGWVVDAAGSPLTGGGYGFGPVLYGMRRGTKRKIRPVF